MTSKADDINVSCIQPFGRSMRAAAPRWKPVVIDDCHFSAEKEPKNEKDKAD